MYRKSVHANKQQTWRSPLVVPYTTGWAHTVSQALVIPLGRIAAVSAGFPFRKKLKPEPGGDVAVVQFRDFNATASLAGPKAVMLHGDDRYERFLLQAGDLLFQSRGSRHPVAIVESDVRGIAASGLHTVRPDTQRALPEYLAWWLNHPASQAKFKDEVARGTNVPFVSVRDLMKFMVPVPSLEAQRRIVDVDRLRRRERSLRTELDRLTQQLVDGATLAAATGHS
jgi:hypothetical protein